MRCFATALAWLVFATSAQAQINKALDLVPDDALGFVLIKDLRQLSNAVEETAKKLEVAERVSLLELIQEQMGIREGINPDGSAMFIVLGGKSDQVFPNAVFAVAVADFAKVAEQLGVKEPKDGINEGDMAAPSRLLAGVGGTGPKKSSKMPMLVAKRGGFVLLTVPDNRNGLEQVLNSRKASPPPSRPLMTGCKNNLSPASAPNTASRSDWECSWAVQVEPPEAQRPGKQRASKRPWPTSRRI